MAKTPAFKDSCDSASEKTQKKRAPVSFEILFKLLELASLIVNIVNQVLHILSE